MFSMYRWILWSRRPPSGSAAGERELAPPEGWVQLAEWVCGFRPVESSLDLLFLDFGFARCDVTELYLSFIHCSSRSTMPKRCSKDSTMNRSG